MKQSSRLSSFAFLVILHFCTVTASRADILAGPITNTASGHVYYLLSPTNWPSAEAQAVALGGHLVAINDAAENTWVFTMFASHGGVARTLWLGLNDASVEGNWVWAGGEASAYRKWAPGEPNNGGGYYPNEDQAAMRGPAQTYPDSWNDAPADQAHAAVVEVAGVIPSILAGPITNTANGHIYYLLSPTNWSTAESQAVGLGGHLVTINDALENTWVFNTFASLGGVARTLWLGLNDAAHEGNWVWVGGETSTYVKWAPGEPNSGGGFYPDEDQAAMRGPAQAYPDSWNDAPADQLHAAVVEVAITPPPTNTVVYDVAAAFSTNSNPNGVWSYGASTALGSPMVLFADRGRWTGLDYWRAPILLGVPGVYRNPSNITVTNATGTAVLGPGQLSFYPGPDGEVCIIRFTAPISGLYQVSGAFTGVDPQGTTTDVHVIVNGVTFNGSVNGYGAGSGPSFNLIVDLGTGDPIDFAVGRSAISQFSFDSTGLSVQISGPTNAPPTGIAPTINSQPQDRTATAGTNVSFMVSATGTAPLSYQWRRNGTNLPGATSPLLLLVNVQPANAGTYSVRVTNAFGSVTSSNAVLTVLPASTNCVSAPDGLVSWWRAESNALDSAHGNHGTLVGNTRYGEGRVRQAFVFDGSGDGVRIGNPTNLQLQNFTIEAWIKRSSSSTVSLSSGGAFAELFCYGTGGYAFGFLSDGRLFLSKVDIDQTQTSVAIADTNFHHVAVTKSGSTVVFYIDGTAHPSPPYNTTYTFETPVAIGARGDNLDASFYGTIDELTVYNRALGSNELAAIRAAGSAGKCPASAGIPPTITSQPQSQTANAGASVTFSVTATGTAQLSYQWRRNETNIASAIGTSLTLSNVQPANGGSYSVRVANAFGAVNSSNAMLTVLAPGTNCVARPSGLVSWWRAEENANDSAGTNHGMTPFGITYVTGQVGQAFDFNGPSPRVSVPDSPDFKLTNAFTVEGWIYARQSNSGIIFIRGDNRYGLDPIILTMLQAPGNVAFQIENAEGHSAALQAGVQLNQWQHIAVTLDGDNGAMRIYVNGVVQAQTNTLVRPMANLDPSQQPAIGIGNHGGTAYQFPFNGSIDEISLYSRALASSEVQAIYQAGSAGKCVNVTPPVGGIFGTASLVCEPGSSAKLCFAGVAGNTYIVQASTNLIDWEAVGVSVAGSNGACEFADPDSTKLPCRYYRVVMP